MTRFLLSLALCLLPWASAGPAAGADADPAVASVLEKALGVGKKPDPDTAPPAPVAVPVSEIPAQAEAALTGLRDVETALAASDGVIAAIERELPVLAREIDARQRETARIVAQRPSLELLKNQDRSWRRLREAALEWKHELEQRVARLERDRARLAELEGVWRETLKLTRASQDGELVRRVESLLAGVSRTQAALDKLRTHTLRLQSRVTALDLRITEAVELVGRAREETLARVFSRDSPPLWRERHLAPGVSDSQESLSVQWTALETYWSRRSDRFILHAVLFAALAGALFWMRRRSARRAAQDAELERVELVFATPVATAMVLSFLGSRWIYPQAPSLMWMIIGAAALIPTVIVLRPLVEPRLRPLLFAVIAFFLIDEVRAVAASMREIPRYLFLAEMVFGALFLLWYARWLRAPPDVAPQEPRGRRWLRRAAGAACGVFAFAALANACGYVALGNLVGNAVLGGAYIGVILYAAVQILDAIVIIALRTPPLNLLGMVQRHHDLLRGRARYALATIAGVLWSLVILERLAVRQPILAGLKRLLEAGFTAGSISITVGDVIAFILVVWGSFVVSRLVRFFLDEDVYPRAHLQRGLYYAISRTLHYVILVAGFFFAVALLGFDMTKFTILAGAFTVGVGFGLQNIFNNFVSGLILLFERPVQVGDMIQIEDMSGIVERIGIRASVVRAAAGSEIIVPNGKLISERLVNWTLSARRRGLELPVAVAHGANPKRVIEIIERVAAAHPRIQKEPAPEVLFTKLGPDWMGFELRAYTDHVEDWMRVRSELAVAVSDALAAEKIAMK